MQQKKEVVLWGESSRVLDNHSLPMTKVNGIHLLRNPEGHALLESEMNHGLEILPGPDKEVLKQLKAVFQDYQVEDNDPAFTEKSYIILDCSAVLQDVRTMLRDKTLVQDNERTDHDEKHLTSTILDFLTQSHLVCDGGTVTPGSFIDNGMTTLYQWVCRWISAVTVGTNVTVLSDVESGRFAERLLQHFNGMKNCRYAAVQDPHGRYRWPWKDRGCYPSEEELEEFASEVGNIDSMSPTPKLCRHNSSSVVRFPASNTGDSAGDLIFSNLSKPAVSFYIHEEDLYAHDTIDHLVNPQRLLMDDFREPDYRVIAVTDDRYPPCWLQVKKPIRNTGSATGIIQLMPREIFSKIISDTTDRFLLRVMADPSAAAKDFIEPETAPARTESQTVEECREEWRRIKIRIVGNKNGNIPDEQSPGIAVYEDKKLIGRYDSEGLKDLNLVRKNSKKTHTESYALLLKVEKDGKGSSYLQFTSDVTRDSRAKQIERLRGVLKNCVGYQVVTTQKNSGQGTPPIRQASNEPHKYYVDFTVERCSSHDEL